MSVDPNLIARLAQKEHRFSEINEELSDPEIAKNPTQYQRFARELGELREVVELGVRLRELVTRHDDAKQILADGSDDELVELAKEELQELVVEIANFEGSIRVLLVPKDPNDIRNAIVEIRAGTGGDEAGLFASDLFRMYNRFQ